jgi:predicted dehydrogenase
MYKMLEEQKPDAVWVLVEPDRLFRCAADCMKRGYHVFMEKPAGISYFQADSLARISKKYGVKCAVGMNRRQIPVVQEVIRRMKELTEITQVDGMFMKCTDLAAGSWDYASAYDCDGVHALDLVRYLAGGEVVDCATVAAKFSGCPVENGWSSVMRFDNGVTGTMRSNYQAGARLHMFEIHGPNASAFINVGFGTSDCEATIIYTQGGSMYSLASGGVGGMQKEFIDGKALAGTDKFYAYYGYKQEDENFVKAILNDEEPLCSIADAALSMKLVETVHKTAI